MRQWCWGCICSVSWKVRLTGIRILSAGPKLAFGQAAVNSAWVLNCLNFQGHKITFTSATSSLRAKSTALHILQAQCPLKPPLFFIHHPLLFQSTKKISDNPIKFPSSLLSSEDELPSHHSSNDGMSDYSPPWSFEKEDPVEEDEDEDNACNTLGVTP